MKTNKQSKKSSGLESRSAQLSSAAAEAPAQSASAQAPADKKDTRLPIDAAARKKNRTLPTPKVLNALLASLPDVYRLAEVVGGRPDSGWAWVRFSETPAAEIRQQLAQLGFHWNRERQAWQHPCGNFSLGSQFDPHEKYSSYFPAHAKAA